MRDYLDTQEFVEEESESLKGTNFLVSAVMLLKRQKRDLQEENKRLRLQLEALENQNAAFLNLSADRLLGKMG